MVVGVVDGPPLCSSQKAALAAQIGLVQLLSKSSRAISWNLIVFFESSSTRPAQRYCTAHTC
jgi:hypothetical protein